MTDQPPSQPSAEEPDGDAPAAFVHDEPPTQVSSPEPAATEPAAAGPAPSAAPESPTAPEPPAAFAPSGTTAPPPPVSPPRVTEPTSDDDDSAGLGGLAAAFPAERPERALGAAFAGGLALALILKRLAR